MSDYNGWTPLMRAIKVNHRDLTRLLLSKQADINKTNRWKQTPVSIAIENQNKNIIGIFAEKEFVDKLSELDKIRLYNTTFAFSPELAEQFQSSSSPTTPPVVSDYQVADNLKKPAPVHIKNSKEDQTIFNKVIAQSNAAHDLNRPNIENPISYEQPRPADLQKPRENFRRNSRGLSQGQVPGV